MVPLHLSLSLPSPIFLFLVSAGPCMNGNAAGLGRILSHQFNPYGDAAKDVGRGSRGPRQYASSVGEHDYSEIDNFDINSGGNSTSALKREQEKVLGFLKISLCSLPFLLAVHRARVYECLEKCPCHLPPFNFIYFFQATYQTETC
jgi:hypothetical protein